MPAAIKVPSMSKTSPEVVDTRVDDQTPMHRIGESSRLENWSNHILTLLSWLRDPSQLEDDGVTAPQRSIIRLAIDYAEQSRDRALAAPTRIATDSNGGIVFTLANPRGAEEIHFWDDGKVEYLDFVGNDLKVRREV